MNRREALQKTFAIAGTSALTPALMGLLQSCQQQERLSWQPVFLNEEQAGTISALVDTILPQTETPGALDMKVDIFIDKVFGELYDKAGQSWVLDEITKLNDRCADQYGSTFTGLTDQQRASFLSELESEYPKYNSSVWGTAVGEQEPVGFYRSVKTMALWGYFTSEEIGKNVLNYDPVPGEYKGCIPLEEVGKVWSL